MSSSEPPDQKLSSKCSASRRKRRSFMILSKITAHDQKDAASSRNMTILTMRSAWRKSVMIDRSCGAAPPSATESTTLPCMGRNHPSCCIVEGGQSRAQDRRQALRPAVLTQAGDLEDKANQQRIAAPHILIEIERGAAERLEPRHDDQIVIEPRRQKIVGGAAPHHKDEPGLGAQPLLLDAEAAQHLGARPLGEFEVVGIIDEAGGVGVLVIDTHGKEIGAVGDDAVAREQAGHDAASSASGSSCASMSSCAARGRSGLTPR